MDRDEILRSVTDRLRTEGRAVIAAYVYGSTARGDATAGSDVDVGLVLARGPVRDVDDLPHALPDDLEDLLGRSVDVVILNGAPPDLLHRVLRDGILVYEIDPEARVRFEVDARNAYFDLLPYLRRYRRVAIESA